MGSGETDQPSGGCRFAQEAEILRCRKCKVLYLLIFMSRKGRAYFSIALVKPGLFLATLSPDGFPGPFRSCCRLTPYRGYSWRPCFCVPYLRDMKIPQGNS